jgi:hypothetical protein
MSSEPAGFTRIPTMAVALLPALAGCMRPSASGRQDELGPRNQPALTVQEITVRIDELPSWPRAGVGAKLTTDGWIRLMQLAIQLQRANSATVKEALRAYADPHRRTDDWSKAYLLLRVMFTVPDEPFDPRKHNHPRLPCGGFWVGYPREEDETKDLSMSMPMVWTRDGPQIRGMLAGYSGPPYDAAKEYTILLENYPFRELQKELTRMSKRIY